MVRKKRGVGVSMVEGLGFRVWVLGFGFRIYDSGFGVYGLRFMIGI
jgi:hypothetical protein